jgi:hypothetical protein
MSTEKPPGLPILTDPRKPLPAHFPSNPLKTRPKFFSQVCRKLCPIGAQWSHDRQAEMGRPGHNGSLTDHRLLATGCRLDIGH